MSDQVRNTFASALGHLGMRWSELEASVDTMIAKLIPLPDDMRHAALGHIGFRERVFTLKTVGFIRKPDADWFNELEAVLNCIDNEIRNERNRFTHDIWLPSNEPHAMDKVNRAPKIKKKPGSGELEFQAYERKPISLLDITRITTRIGGATEALQELHNDYPTPSTFARICARQFLPAPEVGVPSPKGPKREKPPPPPGSSGE